MGVNTMPAFYTSKGTVHPVSTSEQRQLSQDILPFMVLNSNTFLSRVQFPMFSLENWFPVGNMLLNFGSLLNGTTDAVYQFYRFTINFQFPASLTESTTTVWEVRTHNLSSQEIDVLMNAILYWQSYRGRGDNFSDILTPYSLPLTLALPMSEAISERQEFRRSAWLLPSTTTSTFEWVMTFADDANIPFLSSREYYQMLIWSQSVASSNWIGSFIGSVGGIIGLYFLIVIAVGMLIRRSVTGGIDSLWIARMERPQKLYRMVVAIEAFRVAKELEKESEIVNTFLDTLRSRETCLKITASDAPG
jgi:hypothetical protein